MLSTPLHVADVVIEEVELPAVSDDDLGHLNTIENILRSEVFPDDPPVPVEVTAARARHIPDFIGQRDFWAREADGAIAGRASAWWTKTDDNRHLIRTDLGVRPDRRLRGIGKALLSLVVEATLAEARTLIVGRTLSSVPAGVPFARRTGAEPALAEHVNRLLISEVDREMIDRWVEHGPHRAPGYSLVVIDGPAPDAYIEEVVAMANVMNTAPRDDLEMEDENFDAAQLRDWERAASAQGDEWWALYARHDASGGFAGYTHVAWNPSQPQTVYQYGTAVKPEHRGHALGKWLKAAMLQRIIDERTDVKDVRTGNADSNDAMLGINRALGFRPYIAATAWQVRVDRVREYLDGS